MDLPFKYYTFFHYYLICKNNYVIGFLNNNNSNNKINLQKIFIIIYNHALKKMPLSLCKNKYAVQRALEIRGTPPHTSV